MVVLAVMVEEVAVVVVWWLRPLWSPACLTTCSRGSG